MPSSNSGRQWDNVLDADSETCNGEDDGVEDEKMNGYNEERGKKMKYKRLTESVGQQSKDG